MMTRAISDAIGQLRRIRRFVACALLLGVSAEPASTGPPIRPDSLVPAGKPAPEVALTTLEGQEVSLSGLKGRIVMLLFGELYNENSIAAARSITAVLERPSLAGLRPSAFMVITQASTRDELLAEAASKAVRVPILHDVGRRAFAAYHVMVLPSLVVIDGNGTTVLPCAGFPLGFEDMVIDALLNASGRMTDQEFSRRRSSSVDAAIPKEQIRAGRLATLADVLAARGDYELAISTYRDAIGHYPDCVTALTGLGNCLLLQGKLVDAEKYFLDVLSLDPESTDAALGMIRIQTRRGGDELGVASERIREILRTRPNDAHVVYTAGVVAEASGDASGALGFYKKAAELLLFQRRS